MVVVVVVSLIDSSSGGSSSGGSSSSSSSSSSIDLIPLSNLSTLYGEQGFSVIMLVRGMLLIGLLLF